MRKIFLQSLAALMIASAAAHGEIVFQVRARYICHEAEARQVFDALERDAVEAMAVFEAFQSAGRCSEAPGIYRVTAILKRGKDFEGDAFALVAISEGEDRLATLAWPGMNSDIPRETSI